MPLEESRFARHFRRWSRRTVILLAVIVVLLLAVRLAAPYVIKRQINARLDSIPGYVGQVADVHLAVWRGAYALKGIAIYRQNGKVREPFFLCERIDFSVAWRELVHRRIVSDIVAEAPQLIFVKGPTKETSTTDTDRRWQEVIQDIFPIDITHLEITKGLLRYVDDTKQPKADLFIKNMKVLATGLRNHAGEDGQEMPAEIYIEGDSLGAGRLKVVLNAEPLAAQPHFHVSFKLDNVNLPALNDSLRAYANVDVGKGTFRLAGEMAGKDGGFQGYVKPFFEDLDFKNIEDKQRGIGAHLWEKIVGGLAWLVKNKSRDQVATRIPFEGHFGDPKIGLWRTIANLFRHGFIRAFNPTVEGTLHADNILPSGKSADGKNVPNVRDDRAGAGSALKDHEEDTRAGAPTGRPTPPAKK